LNPVRIGRMGFDLQELVMSGKDYNSC
jgi:hypothetical protein